MHVIEETVNRLQLGNEMTWHNLTVFPLLDERSGAPDYLTVDEAMADRKVRVTEVSAGGSVPELCFVNDSDRSVLLLDGEELLGAKQNRIPNLTVLVPKKTKLNIPVSCVEAGRWARQTEAFAAASHAHYASGRAAKMTHVSDSLHASRGQSRRSNQSAVWQDVAAMACLMDVASPTGAAAEIYETHAPELDSHVDAFAPVENQIGAVFAINGKVVGVELFDSAETFRKLASKLIRSYAVDAIRQKKGEGDMPSRETAETFLRSLASMQAESFGAIGLGEDVRLAAEEMTGAGLIVDGRIVHLSAFQKRPA
jgi:hypothetical protein